MANQALIDAIFDAAAEVYGLTRREMMTGGYAGCADARGAAAAIILDLTDGMTMQRLGMMMDGRDAKTIRHAVQRYRIQVHHYKGLSERDYLIRSKIIVDNPLLGATRSEADVLNAMGL